MSGVEMAVEDWAAGRPGGEGVRCGKDIVRNKKKKAQPKPSEVQNMSN